MQSIFPKILLSLFALLLCSSPAAAQTENETRALVNRIDQLEAQIRGMGSSSSYFSDRPPGLAPSGGSGGGNSVANLEVRMAALEEQMRSMNGQLERQTYDIAQTKTRIDKLQSDLEQRLTTLEQKPPAGPQSIVNPPPADNALPANPADNGSAAAQTPEQEYDAAYGQLQRRDFEGAEAAFRTFLKKYPGNSLASNAQYWFGESLYARGKYNEAVAAFAEGYKKYPKGAKAADTLLKLGVSLADAKKTKEACTVFRQLPKDFTAVPESIAARAENEMKRLKCP